MNEVSKEQYENLQKVAQEALNELERLNTFIALNESVIANLKNVLV